MKEIDKLRKLESRVYGRTLSLDLFYPREPDLINEIQIGLCDVRAADSLRISYDFARDGWVIRQQESLGKGKDPDEGEWREVYFAEAWALERER